METTSELPRRFSDADVRPDRRLLGGHEQARYWSQLSSGRPTRVIEQFRVVPNTLGSHGSELQWLSTTEWEALALELHTSWRSVVSERGDLEFVDISEFLFLTHAVERAKCQDLVGPHGIRTLYNQQKSGGCTRGWPLNLDESHRATESGAVDGVLTVEVVVHRCRLEGETTWWTGVSFYAWASILGQFHEGSPTGHYKTLGFMDARVQREDCVPLPLTENGRQVDYRALVEVLSSQFHRRISAHSKGLPRMDQPWPAGGLGHIND